MAGEDMAPAGTGEGSPLLNEELWERLDNAVYEHFDSLKGLGKPDIEDLSVFAASVEIHFYLQNTLALQDEGVVERLLKFENPLAVVLDAWEQNGEAEDFDINRLLDEIDAEATHPLWKDPDAALARLPELMERVTKNLSDYHSHVQGFGKPEIIDMAHRIAAMNDAHFYLTEHHDFEPSEVDLLLQYQNPLEIVADEWERRAGDISDMCFALDTVFSVRYDLSRYARAEDAATQPEQPPQPEAPASLHERLEDAKREVAQRPAPEGKPPAAPEL